MYKQAVELMEADIGNELVALEPQAGNCFGFNEVATVVWRRLAEPKSFDQLRDSLVEDYDVSAEQCSRELRALLDEMKAQGLVEQA
jgi:hypothetical protein